MNAPAQSTSTPRILLSEDQAAETLGVSERTFAALREQPWMPKPVRLGPRLLRWVRAELEAAVVNAPRADVADEPAALLRARIERLKQGNAS